MTESTYNDDRYCALCNVQGYTVTSHSHPLSSADTFTEPKMIFLFCFFPLFSVRRGGGGGGGLLQSFFY
jgi:hypothetical protein